MGKALDILVRIKNVTDSTVAVARSVVPPRGVSPIKAKKLKDIESIIKASDAGTIEILSPDESSLRVLANLTNENTGKLELPEESLAIVEPKGEEAGSGEPASTPVDGVPPVDPKGATGDAEKLDGVEPKEVADGPEKQSEEPEATQPIGGSADDKGTGGKGSEGDLEQNETLDLGEEEEAPKEPAAKAKRQSRAKN